jgi:hypothetical protein
MASSFNEASPVHPGLDLDAPCLRAPPPTGGKKQEDEHRPKSGCP